MRRSRHSKVNAKRFVNWPYKLFELLFHTQFNTPYVQSIDGQRISDDLLDFSENIKEKQVHYFKKRWRSRSRTYATIHWAWLEEVSRMSENGNPLKKKIWMALIVKSLIDNYDLLCVFWKRVFSYAVYLFFFGTVWNHMSFPVSRKLFSLPPSL